MKRAELQQALEQRFNLSELRQICFDLALPYENFSSKLSPFSRELVEYCERTNRLDELLSTCKQLRPSYNDWFLDPRYHELPSTFPAEAQTPKQRGFRLNLFGKELISFVTWVTLLVAVSLIGLTIVTAIETMDASTKTPTPTGTTTTFTPVPTDTPTETTAASATLTPIRITAQSNQAGDLSTVTVTQSVIPSRTPTHTVTPSHTPTIFPTVLPTTAPSATSSPTATLTPVPGQPFFTTWMTLSPPQSVLTTSHGLFFTVSYADYVRGIYNNGRGDEIEVDSIAIDVRVIFDPCIPTHCVDSEWNELVSINDLPPSGTFSLAYEIDNMLCSWGPIHVSHVFFVVWAGAPYAQGPYPRTGEGIMESQRFEISALLCNF